MSIYQHISYIEALDKAIEEQRTAVSGWTLSKLAEQSQMQPSYLTNVLKGRCDFNSDQLYRVCENLEFKVDEIEYLLLLLESKRTTYKNRKRQLEKKIEQVRSQQLRSEKYLKTKPVELSAEQLEQYYLNPYIPLVHIYLGFVSGPVNAETLAKNFLTTKEQMTGVLKVLEEIKYIRRKGTSYEVLVEGQHLPRESHILRPHHLMMRMKSLDQIQRMSAEQSYSFSATISTMPEVRTKIQSEFLKFLKAAEKLVKDHPSEKMYQINFDLFPWEISE